jgi:multiple sugar transport system substrate-binding protein
MLHKRKLLALGYLTVLVMVVSACAAPVPPTSAPAAAQPAAAQPTAAPAPTAVPAAEPVTVVFWNVWGGTRAPLLREMLDKFEAANPGIKVENVTLDGTTDTQKMLTAVAGGSPPDIYMTHTNDLTMWAGLNAFKPLDEYVKQDNIDLGYFYGPSVQGSTYNGQLIQLPFKVMQGMSLWYNKDLFREAGLDPEKPPATWQELEEYAIKLMKKNGDVITQAAMNICTNCVQGPEDPFNEWLSRNGGSIVNAQGEVVFDSDRGIETMQWMKSFMDNTAGGYDNFVKQFGENWTELRPAFYAGTLAMHMDGPWFLDILRKEAPDLEAKIGVAPLPINGSNPDAKQTYNTYGVPGYAIPAGSKNPDAAWKVLKFIAMEGGCEFFQKQSRIDHPSPTCVDQDAKAKNPFFDTFEQVKASVVTIPGPSAYSKIATRFKEMEQTVLLGKIAPEEGVKQAAADARGYLK